MGLTPMTIKRTLTTVAITTAVVFVADIINDGLMDSPGSHFEFKVPKGRKLAESLAVGFVTALILDIVIHKITFSLRPAHEQALEKLIESDLEKIEKAGVKPEGPAKIVWKKPLNA